MPADETIIANEKKDVAKKYLYSFANDALELCHLNASPHDRNERIFIYYLFVQMM